jgi:hypothetical protein
VRLTDDCWRALLVGLLAVALVRAAIGDCFALGAGFPERIRAATDECWRVLLVGLLLWRWCVRRRVLMTFWMGGFGRLRFQILLCFSEFFSL